MAYVGPGDVYTSTWKVWWGLRGFSAAYSTGSNPCVDVRRASDSTTTTINITAQGDLDTATLTTFLASTTGFVSKWYDQTGNGLHLTQATTGSQPQILLTGGTVAAKPWIKYLGTILAGSMASSSPQSMTAVCKSDSTGFVGLLTTGNSGQLDLYHGSANSWTLGAGGSTTVTVADTLWHVANGASSGTAGFLNVDGTLHTGTTGSVTAGTSLNLGSFDSGANLMNGGFAEMGIAVGSFSTTDAANLYTNQFNYWFVAGVDPSLVVTTCW